MEGSRSSNKHCDAVYRAIFQLEAGKKGASEVLCESLLMAWLDKAALMNPPFRKWLRKITPICQALISAPGESVASSSLRAHVSARAGKLLRGPRMHIDVKQESGVRFIVEARNHTIMSDQPKDNGGEDSGMTPPELLLASLGTCAAFYAAEYLRSRKLAHAGVSVSVTAEKLKGPARLGNFEIRVQCPVDLTPEQYEAITRSVELCLIKNTLLSAPRVEVSIDLPVGSLPRKQ